MQNHCNFQFWQYLIELLNGNPCLTSIILLQICIMFIGNYCCRLWFFLDSTLVVLPFTLSFTALANYTLELYVALLILAGLTVICIKYGQFSPYNAQKKEKKVCTLLFSYIMACMILLHIYCCGMYYKAMDYCTVLLFAVKLINTAVG